MHGYGSLVVTSRSNKIEHSTEWNVEHRESQSASVYITRDKHLVILAVAGGSVGKSARIPTARGQSGDPRTVVLVYSYGALALAVLFYSRVLRFSVLYCIILFYRGHCYVLL